MNTFRHTLLVVAGFTALSTIAGCSRDGAGPENEEGISYLTDGRTDQVSEGLIAGTTTQGPQGNSINEPSYSNETVRAVTGEENDLHVGTVRFDPDSTELTDLAESTLDELVSTIDHNAPTQIHIRTVNPNNVDPDALAEVTSDRIEAVKSYLQDKDLKIEGWEEDQVSGRDYERIRGDIPDPDVWADDITVEEGVQKVVITIVSLIEGEA